MEEYLLDQCLTDCWRCSYDVMIIFYVCWSLHKIREGIDDTRVYVLSIVYYWARGFRIVYIKYYETILSSSSRLCFDLLTRLVIRRSFLPVEMCRRDGCGAEMLCRDGCRDASSVSLGASNLALVWLCPHMLDSHRCLKGIVEDETSGPRCLYRIGWYACAGIVM